MVSRREGESVIVRRPGLSAGFSACSSPSSPWFSSSSAWSVRRCAKSSSVLESGSRPHHSSGAAPGACAFARRARVREAASSRYAEASGVSASSSGALCIGAPFCCVSFCWASSARIAFIDSSTRVRRSSATRERRVAGRRTRVMGTSVESPTASVGSTKSKNSPGA